MKRDTLISHINRKKSCLCVGLDPDINKIPECLKDNKNPVLDFNKAIVNATAPFCVAYKPNMAFYECLGSDGWKTLEDTVKYIRDNYPDHFIIADAKRGDIGNTAGMYAKTFFNHLDVDAVTLSPYMGMDSISPYLDYDDKWVIVLALTSNNGSADFQQLSLKNDGKLYEEVIKKCRKDISPDRLMFVIGATHSDMLKETRDCCPDNILLIPGVGAQGGSLKEVMQNCFTSQTPVLVNSSRGILYASDGIDFAEAAAREARKLADEMSQYFK